MPTPTGSTVYSAAPAFLMGNPAAITVPALPLQSGWKYKGKIYLSAGPITDSTPVFAPLYGVSKPAGGADFYLNALFDNTPELATTVPTFKQTAITVSTNHCRPLNLKYGLYFRNVAQTVESFAGPYYVFAGGLDPYDFTRVGQAFLTAFTAGQKQWLTWQPDNKRIDPYQHEYLYFICNLSPLPSSLKLWVKVYYTDNTTYEYNPTSFVSPSTMQVYCVPVGFANLNMQNLPKVVSKYEVVLTDQNDQALTVARTYWMDYKPWPNPVYLIFRNSLGGYDTLRFTGNDIETFRTSYSAVEVNTPAVYDYKFRERIETNVTGFTEITLPTGYLPAGWLKYLKELQLTRDAYRITDVSYIGLSHAETSELETYNKGNRMEFATIKLRHQYKESYFSRLTAV